MAIFHMSAQTISRGKGHSSVAAAAYRHGQKLTDEFTGEIHDYSKKKGVSDSIILLPKNADRNFLKPEYLWNTIEKSEKRKDAQLAREFNIALPVEMTDEQKKALAIEFCNKNFVKNGMIADIAFHKLDSDNPHFHVMLTTRRLTPDGLRFSTKERKWNDKDQLNQWREKWADTTNEHLQKANIDARIDHRSLKDQKADLDALTTLTIEQQAQSIRLDRQPTIHRGHSRNPERQSRFDTLQDVKVSQEAKALNHIENLSHQSTSETQTHSPAASIKDAKKVNSKSNTAATVSGSNINLADEKNDKNLHLTEAQREEIEEQESKEAAAKKKAYLCAGAAVSEFSQNNKTQSKSEFLNNFRKMKKSFTQEGFDEERKVYENIRKRKM